MKKYFLPFLLLLIITASSCKKQIVYQTRYLTFNANPHYVGSYDTTNFVSHIYIQEQKNNINFLVDLIGGDVSKTYKLQIYQYDTTQIYGYSENPVIDMGTMANNLPVGFDYSTMTFQEFTENFKGYYIIHDPANIQKDTTTLLIFGKIGNW